MSALGGGGAAAQDLIDAIKTLSREFSSAGQQARSNQLSLSGFMPGNIGAVAGGAMGGPLGAMAGEALGNNIFVNTALKTGREFIAETASNVLGDYAKYGSTFGNSFGESVSQGAMKAAAVVPYFGDLADQAVQIQGNAASRTKGLFAAAARGGATITKEMVTPSLEFFQREEGFANAMEQTVNAASGQAHLVKQAKDAVPRYAEAEQAAHNAAIETIGLFSQTLKEAALALRAWASAFTTGDR